MMYVILIIIWSHRSAKAPESEELPKVLVEIKTFMADENIKMFIMIMIAEPLMRKITFWGWRPTHRILVNFVYSSKIPTFAM